MILLVGLGNPGPKYRKNRHNIGFMVVDELLRRAGAATKEKFKGEWARTTHCGKDVVLLKPMTFMNLSGESVRAAADFFRVEPQDTVVVHDELDLPFGRVKLKQGGGHAGHNGLRSISAHMGADYARIRCGIDRPAVGAPAAWVLSDFSAAESPWVQQMVDTAADAAESILRDGIAAAMNRFNAARPDE
ncbi:MAG: peptidyl-tRNA hydrolase [Myxococcales bacterium]